MIHSQSNADRVKIVAAIKAGRLTIPQAARKYGVPVSGVIGWLKAAGVAIPEQFSRPRRERSAEPLSAGTMGRRKQTDK